MARKNLFTSSYNSDMDVEVVQERIKKLTWMGELAIPRLLVTVRDNVATVTWKDVDAADKYVLYRTDKDGRYNIIGEFKPGVCTYEETLDRYETYYYYLVACNTVTGQSSKPNNVQQVLADRVRTGKFSYGAEAADIELVVKPDDTVHANSIHVEGRITNKSGGVFTAYVNGQEISGDTTDTGFSYDIELEDGGNTVDVYYTADGSCTRKSYYFSVLKNWDITVDKTYTGADGDETDGIPTYRSISAAIASIPSDTSLQKVILVKKGVYDERIILDKSCVKLIGEDRQGTRIAKSVCVAEGTATGMNDRNVVYVAATACGARFENLTIENTYAYSNQKNEQADALHIAADNVVCVNVALISFQDTLASDTRGKKDDLFVPIRNYFYKCYITGNVDFIYGSGSVVFYDCDIVGRYTPHKKEGCYTAGRQYHNIPYGFVFYDCRFLAEAGIGQQDYRISRPWGPLAGNVLVNCYLCDAVIAQGYSDMSGNSYKEARFAEYMTYGPGFAGNNDRVNLLAEEAQEFNRMVMEDLDYVTERNILPTDVCKPLYE